MIKKTCNGCYAADTGRHPKLGEPHGCILGFQTDGQGHPQESCPKPKSWKQLKNIEKERDMRTCENCKYAALAGGDCDPAMGGGYTPVTVDECQHPSVTADEMDLAIERGIAGNCKLFIEEG